MKDLGKRVVSVMLCASLLCSAVSFDSSAKDLERTWILDEAEFAETSEENILETTEESTFETVVETTETSIIETITESTTEENTFETEMLTGVGEVNLKAESANQVQPVMTVKAVSVGSIQASCDKEIDGYGLITKETAVFSSVISIEFDANRGDEFYSMSADEALNFVWNSQYEYNGLNEKGEIVPIAQNLVRGTFDGIRKDTSDETKNIFMFDATWKMNFTKDQSFQVVYSLDGMSSTSSMKELKFEKESLDDMVSCSLGENDYVVGKAFTITTPVALNNSSVQILNANGEAISADQFQKKFVGNCMNGYLYLQTDSPLKMIVNYPESTFYKELNKEFKIAGVKKATVSALNEVRSESGSTASFVGKKDNYKIVTALSFTDGVYKHNGKVKIRYYAKSEDVTAPVKEIATEEYSNPTRSDNIYIYNLKKDTISLCLKKNYKLYADISFENNEYVNNELASNELAPIKGYEVTIIDSTALKDKLKARESYTIRCQKGNKTYVNGKEIVLGIQGEYTENLQIEKCEILFADNPTEIFQINQKNEIIFYGTGDGTLRVYLEDKNQNEEEQLFGEVVQEYAINPYYECPINESGLDVSALLQSGNKYYSNQDMMLNISSDMKSKGFTGIGYMINGCVTCSDNNLKFNGKANELVEAKVVYWFIGTYDTCFGQFKYCTYPKTIDLAVDRRGICLKQINLQFDAKTSSYQKRNNEDILVLDDSSQTGKNLKVTLNNLPDKPYGWESIHVTLKKEEKNTYETITKEVRLTDYSFEIEEEGHYIISSIRAKDNFGDEKTQETLVTTDPRFCLKDREFAYIQSKIQIDVKALTTNQDEKIHNSYKCSTDKQTEDIVWTNGTIHFDLSVKGQTAFGEYKVTCSLKDRFESKEVTMIAKEDEPGTYTGEIEIPAVDKNSNAYDDNMVVTVNNGVGATVLNVPVRQCYRSFEKYQVTVPTNSQPNNWFNKSSFANDRTLETELNLKNPTGFYINNLGSEVTYEIMRSNDQMVSKAIEEKEKKRAEAGLDKNSTFSSLDEFGDKVNKVISRTFVHVIDRNKKDYMVESDNEFKYVLSDNTKLTALSLNQNSQDGIYFIRQTICDSAGNKTESAWNYIKVDTTEPVIGNEDCKLLVQASDREGSYLSMTSNIPDDNEFELFINKTFDLDVAMSDQLSGMEKMKLLQYGGNETELQTTEAVSMKEEQKYSYNQKVHYEIDDAGKTGFLYLEVEDEAGNVAKLYTKRFLQEKGMCEIEVSIPTQEENEFFKDTVSVGISVTDDPNDNFSGIQTASYKVDHKEGTYIETVEFINASTPFEKSTSTTFDIGKEGEKLELEDLYIRVNAVDYAGNEKPTYEKRLGNFDNKAPTIQVKYPAGIKGKDTIFTKNVEVVYTITDSFVDQNSLKLNVKKDGESFEPTIEWRQFNGGYDAIVTLSEDGDYFFGDAECSDKAGNKTTEKIESAEFGIDKMNPEIKVVFDNNSAYHEKYYSKARTATITVTEKHFDEALMKVMVGKGANDGVVDSEENMSTGWSCSGDTYTKVISFDQDGFYTLAVSGEDKVGNKGTPFDKVEFFIDSLVPEIEILGVEDHSANAGNIDPIVKVKEKNLTEEGTKIVLLCQGKEIALKKEVSKAGDVSSFHLTNVNGLKDGVYKLSVVITDKAGNEAEDEIQFSLNRNGSTWDLTDVYGLMERHYIRYEDMKDIVITEMNVDTIEKFSVYMSKNDNMMTKSTNGNRPSSLDSKTVYYSRSERNSGNGYEYNYVIYRENFKDEGIYSLTFYSKDRAGNEMNNTIDGKDAELTFIIDNTAPDVLVNGVEAGEFFKSDSQKVNVMITDNYKLDNANIYITDEDGNIVATHKYQNEVKQEGDMLTFDVDTKGKYMTVLYQAQDAAGNKIEKILDNTKLPKEEEEVEETTESSSNRIIDEEPVPADPGDIIEKDQNMAWLIIVCAAFIIAAGTTAVFVIRKKRTNEQK